MSEPLRLIAGVDAVDRKKTPIEEIINSIHTTLLGKDYLPIVESIEGCSTDPIVVINGDRYDNYGVNCYLSLGNHIQVKFAAKKALEEFGVASGASRLTGGTLILHRRLEESLATFLSPDGNHNAVLYSAGYLVNVGVIPSLMAPYLYPMAQEFNELLPKMGRGAIFSDKLNHRCLIDGCFLAESWANKLGVNLRLYWYKHMDPKDLEIKLCRETAERKLIVTDGVFSLHGRIAPLGEIAKLADKYNAMLLVDDAHGTGVLGQHGRGSLEYSGVKEKPNIIHMGTLSKALAGTGGYVIASQEICEYLRYGCATYMFQTAIPPEVVAGIIAAIEIVKSPEGEALRATLRENYNYLRGQLITLGFDTQGSQTQIVPVLIGDEHKAKQFAEELKTHKIFAPTYYYSAVPKGQAIIRINLMATHSRRQLDRLLEVLERLGKKYGII